jgi:two-component system alkaline phosphatase synthesis response regulator PhoP
MTQTNTVKTKASVVIVEDEPAIRDMYKMKLENSGFSAFVAQDGREGLAVIEKAKPDLILLDIKMPVMNGDEMLEKLRQTQWGANIRVIILTNISRDEAPHTLRFLSVDRYVVKAHHTPSQVVEVINEVLGITK